MAQNGGLCKVTAVIKNPTSPNADTYDSETVSLCAVLGTIIALGHL
jgi:hypothetical protein